MKHQKSPFAISMLQLGVRRRFLSAQEHALGSFEMQSISNVLRKHELSDISPAVLDIMKLAKVKLPKLLHYKTETSNAKV